MIDGAYLFRAVSAEWIGTGGITLWTDLPIGMAVRESVLLPATTTEKSQRIDLAGTTKGRTFSVTVTSFTQPLVLLKLAFWVRRLGITSSEWQWIQVPLMPGGGDELIEIPIQIPETPAAWSEMRVSIPQTPEDWQEVPVSVPTVSAEWIEAQVAIPPTPEQWDERNVPIPPSPEAQEWSELAPDA